MIALLGNPNTGQTSLFNRLTGLNQRVGTYAGVTVDRKVGVCRLPNGEKATLLDLPGTYSLNATSVDEEIVTQTLASPTTSEEIKAVVVVVDATQLKRNLLLFTQAYDLGLPLILALNMADLVEKRRLKIDVEGLQRELGIPVVSINARTGDGLQALKHLLTEPIAVPQQAIFSPQGVVPGLLEETAQRVPGYTGYRAWLLANTPDDLMPQEGRALVESRKEAGIHPHRNKGKETVRRYQYIDALLARHLQAPEKKTAGFSLAIDRVLTHKVAGLVLFMGILTLIFQAVFSWSTRPMEWIEEAFGQLSQYALATLPPGPMAELIADGVIPGLAGVLIFIPQIAILFAFIALLEETGYMSRVVFLMDNLMRRFGLNGRSVVPLLSGMACAIPAVMATRTIENPRERLTTILVTPLMTCSARLPVYAILISLVIPATTVLGFLSLQGLVLMAMYALGFGMALAAAWVSSRLLKGRKKSYLLLEMPAYRWPQLRNVGLTIYEKVKSFVFQAGQIILAISILLWVLARYGPEERKIRAEEAVLHQANLEQWGEDQTAHALASARLENSYIGLAGKAIEPAIAPLGYDWNMGIALLSSFAAREVFVGTMATIYAVGSVDDGQTVKQRLKEEVNPETGEPRYTLAVGLSLLLFYAFAMQCMSTLAVVYRDTKGWKWPIIQFVYMGGLAYLSSLLVYQWLS